MNQKKKKIYSYQLIPLRTIDTVNSSISNKKRIKKRKMKNHPQLQQLIHNEENDPYDVYVPMSKKFELRANKNAKIADHRTKRLQNRLNN